jgi:hypothetical protein
MPNSIADLIFNQMQTAGQPRTTTQRTTGTMKATENSPLDLGSLGMLLYFMLSGMGKGADKGALPPLQGSIVGPMSSAGVVPASSYPNPAPGANYASTMGSANSQTPIDYALKMMLGNL